MKSAILIAALGAVVSAHGGVKRYTVDGVPFEAHDPGPGTIKARGLGEPDGKKTIQREWLTYDPVRQATSKNVACGIYGTPAPLTAPIKAGGEITAFWSNWPHNSGPMTVYMTECPGDCAEMTDVNSAKWFKIWEAGLTAGTPRNGKWATGSIMKAQGNSLTTKIPESLKPGNYLIRHETINLARDAEFYVNCANLKVTGAGTAVPGPEVRGTFPGIYKVGDPVLKNYKEQTGTTYKVPGPSVWPGGATGAAAGAATGMAGMSGMGGVTGLVRTACVFRLVTKVALLSRFKYHGQDDDNLKQITTRRIPTSTEEQTDYKCTVKHHGCSSASHPSN
ncbi:lytic polysaccharide monooxygenase [Aulographum hederae CBS 113979]|uniref:AA9 family lytic polysaccharide monooxygenase n=1 Tax=Aulographum hederae CBS 113979 TaxID=1176131 RepID=A0A6G1H624_9PEZI|nr:lytic polysaccharide monooxygenase [Aulographum hederae CBS 113979]